VIDDDSSRTQRFVICGTNPGTHYDGRQDHSAELAIVRAGLAALGVKEVFFADLGDDGYILAAEPTQAIERREILADGVYSFTPQSEVELGRLLKALSDLAWHAWEQAVARPRLA
jgi:hypothetical protein